MRRTEVARGMGDGAGDGGYSGVAPVAQLAEAGDKNRLSAGSTPVGGTNTVIAATRLSLGVWRGNTRPLRTLILMTRAVTATAMTITEERWPAIRPSIASKDAQSGYAGGGQGYCSRHPCRPSRTWRR